MQTQAIVTLHLYTESCARRFHVASSRSWCSLVSLHQTLEAVSPPNMCHPCNQSMSASCAIQCKSMFILTSACPKPYKSHSLCIHTIPDPFLSRTHHASGTFSWLCVSAGGWACTYSSTVQVSCAISMYMHRLRH